MRRSEVRQRCRALIIGGGGLGSPIALVLAKAGVGTLGVADDDDVCVTNLHRQIVFGESDVGRKKTTALGDALTRRTPGIVVEEHRTRILPANAMSLVRPYDIVIEGSDNFATKFLVADACHIAGVPVVHGAAVRWHGTVLSVAPNGAPCYRCLFEDLPREHAPNCAEAGVMGPVVGAVAALQADLALQLIDGSGPAGELITFDGRTFQIRRRRVSRREGCDLCGQRSGIRTIEAERYMESSCDAAW